MAAAAKKQSLPVVSSPLLLLIAGLCLSSTLWHATAAPEPKIRAANLGGWLVTEGWITPCLFDNIPNKEFLDGTRLRFKSVTTGKYLSAENGGGSTIVANRDNPSEWETFKLWRVDENRFQFRVNNGQFWGVGSDGVSVVASATSPGQTETFQIVRNSNDRKLVRIKAPNGLFLRANSETSVTAEARGTGNWDDRDRSVFIMTSDGQMRGEFQLTNGYGQKIAASVLKDHWSSYIVEGDFRYLRDNGLNAVRIPVGWWIATDPAPWPFVTGSLKALDNAFNWAQKYELDVILDLHAAPDGQNSDEHSGSRDGTVAWGSPESIKKSVEAIEFLASRYANRQRLLGIELLNEPRAPGVQLDDLQNYYKDGYQAVRRHTHQAYVIMSSRLGPGVKPEEVLDSARGLSRTVVDVHYYNYYEKKFESMTAQENIDFVYHNRDKQIRDVTRANGPLVFVGEWSATWYVGKASDRRYVDAQLEVFGRATFGWAFWTYNHTENNWSLRWMIDNGYFKLGSTN